MADKQYGPANVMRRVNSATPRDVTGQTTTCRDGEACPQVGMYADMEAT